MLRTERFEVFMKLRRAMVTAAATAVIAPLAMLSAPAAFATDDEPGTSSSSPAAEDTTPPAEDTTPPAEDTTPPAEDTTPPAEDTTPPAEDTTPPAEDTTPPAEDTTPPAGGEETPSPSDSPSASTTPSPSPTVGNGDDFDPYNDCKSLELDDNLTASISGLPSKIVAGSGWHNFKFVVTNNSDKDLKNVWVNAFTEYNDDTNTDDSLALDLANIQVKQNGKWDSTYHESFGNTTLTGTFAAVFGNLEAHTTATLDLRVSIKASAPAGSSFSMSQAVYAGKGGACYGNGDFYDFEVLAAGSKLPGGVGDSKPNGKKPSGVKEDVKPQGGAAKRVAGNLAETGSSSMLPTIGLVGGVAVVAGGGVVFAVRRRKTGGQIA
ncbi:LAETG motif-containing sortase-dependent surface protein [Streptomyces sp. NPDC001020]